MPKTKAKMADMGATATNFFIHTPICCPSRSELISGRYFHNIKTNHAPACMHVNENLVNNNTFAKYLAEAGYTGARVCVFQLRAPAVEVMPTEERFCSSRHVRKVPEQRAAVSPGGL